MGYQKILFFRSTFIFFSCFSCSFSQVNGSQQWNKYWYEQGAEISRYELKQARYGEIHQGEAVLIFVTESFNQKKQVKSDNPTGKDVIPVLKLNAARHFITGVYPYSLFSSTFSPLNSNHLPIKITSSIQEWCGQVFQQVNTQENTYRVQSQSYFESEGDQNYSVAKVWSEEGIWNLIRINPHLLPQGSFKILPNALFSQLEHKEYKIYIAQSKIVSKEKISVYHLSISNLQRSISIEYQTDFPYQILGWEERYQSGGKDLVTQAKRKKLIFLPYWEYNKNRHIGVRQKFNLDN